LNSNRISSVLIRCRFFSIVFLFQTFHLNLSSSRLKIRQKIKLPHSVNQKFNVCNHSKINANKNNHSILSSVFERINFHISIRISRFQILTNIHFKFVFNIPIPSSIQIFIFSVNFLFFSIQSSHFIKLKPLVTHPNITYIDITLKNQSVPLQLIQKTQQTYVVKFHPLIAGDYSIFFKDSTGQILPNSPYLFPVYNPNGIQIQPVNPLQSITDCHFICRYIRYYSCFLLSYLSFFLR